jgi:hypothetical protein
MNNREIAQIIWQKMKGKDLPETYSDKECDDIVTRYWFRAMEREEY